MIIGIGIDILNIDRVKKISQNINDPFILKTYTKNEIDEALKREKPYLYFATRFSGKEAVFKSLSISGDNIYLNEIEILNDDDGVPRVYLYGNIQKVAENKNINNILVSLSYDTDYAGAYAVSESS